MCLISSIALATWHFDSQHSILSVRMGHGSRFQRTHVRSWGLVISEGRVIGLRVEGVENQPQRLLYGRLLQERQVRCTILVERCPLLFVFPFLPPVNSGQLSSRFFLTPPRGKY